MSTTVFVYTMSRAGEVGAWSRYVFPFHVDGFAQLGDDLYIRAGDDLLKVDNTADMDFADDAMRENPFPGVIQWPYLDSGQPGVSKQMLGIDVVANAGAGPMLDVGTDQSNPATFTTPQQLAADNLPGFMQSVPVMAPSLSLRFTYSSLDHWTLQSVTLYLNDMAVGA